ncbi:hypothetical protein BB560_000257 [Smittium megazygosporum]|uniref:Uncharacterized protein n=1 Tax=Smittium megazygosporum TaxID=133381 RepID=A0A2T9ZKT4_9FUNG|nr:hypothetical protein BB560_000257 [Smittium megazygosporum]
MPSFNIFRTQSWCCSKFRVNKASNNSAFPHILASKSNEDRSNRGLGLSASDKTRLAPGKRHITIRKMVVKTSRREIRKIVKAAPRMSLPKTCFVFNYKEGKNALSMIKKRRKELKKQLIEKQKALDKKELLCRKNQAKKVADRAKAYREKKLALIKSFEKKYRDFKDLEIKHLLEQERAKREKLRIRYKARILEEQNKNAASVERVKLKLSLEQKRSDSVKKLLESKIASEQKKNSILLRKLESERAKASSESKKEAEKQKCEKCSKVDQMADFASIVKNFAHDAEQMKNGLVDCMFPDLDNKKSICSVYKNLEKELESLKSKKKEDFTTSSIIHIIECIAKNKYPCKHCQLGSYKSENSQKMDTRGRFQAKKTFYDEFDHISNNTKVQNKPFHEGMFLKECGFKKNDLFF